MGYSERMVWPLKAGEAVEKKKKKKPTVNNVITKQVNAE